MMRRTLQFGLVFALLAGFLAGCGEKAPAPAPVSHARHKVSHHAPSKGVAAASPSAPAAPAPPPYVYNPAGRRDPFEPPMLVKRPVSHQPLTPLQKFNLGQFRVIGVILGKGAPRAMVVAPDGKSYILRKGTKIGHNNGEVVDITLKAVVVQEKFYDFSGTVRTKIAKIELPEREGVK